MKVAINVCCGGFGLSDEAVEECIRRGMTVGEDGADFRVIPSKDRPGPGRTKYYLTHKHKKELRTHPVIVTVIEELGEKSWGRFSKLKVIDIPFDSNEDWTIEEYDGGEWIAEKHQTWGDD